jgi:hypothetical protein
VVQYKPSERHLVVTSDATEAYRLVNRDVDLVRRTVVFLKPDILLLFDRVRLKSAKSTVQLRFQIYNEDGQGKAEMGEADFVIRRPRASLRALLIASNTLAVRSGVHAVPQDVGIYPFAEAEVNDALDHRILTVCTAQQAGKEHGTVAHSALGSSWIVKVNHNGQMKTVEVKVEEDLPTIVIA